MKRKLFFLFALFAITAGAHAQIVVPSDGSDGDFTAPATSTVVDLSLAPTKAWNVAGSGNGVYDPEKWAVVFKYKSVNIAAGRTVTFKNHPATAPVVWLVQGDVTINGSVSLNGAGWNSSTFHTVPGPGGYRGGIAGATGGRLPSGGFGPGGANGPNGSAPSGGSFSTNGDGTLAGVTYGNAQILPLIGGSGGAGYPTTDQRYVGSSGGGAILIAASGTITINGSIVANGGANEFSNSGGSGGAIRLVANSVVGTGMLQAVGGQNAPKGGAGRIRIESNTANNGFNISPVTYAVTPDNPVLIWLPDGRPTARVVSVAGASVPADPRASIDAAADVAVNTSSQVQVVVQTTFVPTTSSVNVRIIPKYGNAFTVSATLTSGDLNQATWTAQVTLPQGYCAIQARAEIK